MTTYELAPILDRITYVPEGATLEPIPWPSGFKPEPQHTALTKDGALPAADVLVITWTAAEAQALADVLTSGVTSKQWVHYANDWDQYVNQLTTRSPAREAKRLGEVYLTRIGDQTVCCFHSQLHPATDSASLPAAALAAQIAAETGAKLVITTGTAGGGPGTILGDVVIATAIHADCTTRLKGHSWSDGEWATTPLAAKQQETASTAALAPLLAPNASRLPAKYATRPLQVQSGHCVSLDYFGFYSFDDHYGLLAYDPLLKVEEMDDFAIAAGVTGMKTPPMLASVRCASDPPMKDGSAASKKLAEQIYQDYGYTAAVGSVVTCWALIAGLAQD